MKKSVLCASVFFLVFMQAQFVFAEEAANEDVPATADRKTRAEVSYAQGFVMGSGGERDYKVLTGTLSLGSVNSADPRMTADQAERMTFTASIGKTNDGSTLSGIEASWGGEDAYGTKKNPKHSGFYWDMAHMERTPTMGRFYLLFGAHGITRDKSGESKLGLRLMQFMTDPVHKTDFAAPSIYASTQHKINDKLSIEGAVEMALVLNASSVDPKTDGSLFGIGTQPGDALYKKPEGPSVGSYLKGNLALNFSPYTFITIRPEIVGERLQYKAIEISPDGSEIGKRSLGNKNVTIGASAKVRF